MINPFNDLSKILDDISANANNAVKQLENIKTLDELLNPKFMAKHTQYKNFSSWLSAGGFDLDNFNNIANKELDNYVVQTTHFKSWEDMKEGAISELVGDIF